MATSPIYGTVTIRADQIQPHLRARHDRDEVTIGLVELAGVSVAILGTSDEIIAACTRLATGAADSEEPRNEYADIPVHDGLDELPMGFHVIVTTEGEQRIDVGQSCTSWHNDTDEARSICVPQVAVGAPLLIDVCQGFDLTNPDPRAGQTLDLGEVLSIGAAPDPFKAPEVKS